MFVEDFSAIYAISLQAKDHEIERGHTIGPELVQAIRESRVSVILLSKNYASSSWCLDELVEILNCKKASGQIVMTIFYQVDPSDVRKQTGDFGIAFKKTCEKKTEEDKKRWMEALAYVANIAGEHSLNWTDEAAMVEKFATDVSNKLNVTLSRDFEEIVGLQAHLRKLISLLCFECDEAKMIGIWGPAGIGKSTIARALFNHLSSDFRLRCFMGNLKGSYKSIMGVDDYDSKLGLQNQLLSKLLNQRDMRVDHLGAVKEWLGDQRVLIILDDVDDLEKLEALAGELSWFGLGSRIIVTTEDKHILKAHGIQDVYHVGFPSSEEALEILCLSAFKQRYVQDDFENVANRVASLCGRLPLGLCVVGSSLRGESKEEWELQLSRIENNLDRKIEDILRVGYDRLSKKDKALFLHIACIFINRSVDDVTSMLADSNMDVKNGLKTLAIKSLVQIHNFFPPHITMHSLLQLLGRQVVHEQSNEPGKRQFLVEAEEIRHVLANETGTGSVIEGMEYLPHLRLLHWDSYPRKRLPPTFQPQCLVELCMKFSNLEKLWGGIQLPSSIRTLHKLEKLNMMGCEKLRVIPTNINLASLEEVNMYRCSRLRTFPDISRNISYLDVRNTKIEDVPASVAERWLRLEKFHIGSKYLKSSTHVPECVSYLYLSNIDIKKIPDCVIRLRRLHSLVIKKCRKLVSLQGLPPSLFNVDVDDCVSLKSVCFSFYKPKSAYITLDDCKCVKSEKDAIRVSSLFHNPVRGIRLFNCFSLEEEARRVIIQQCDYQNVCLPSKEIPEEFTHRAKGNSITIISSGTFSASSRFKACLLVSTDPVEEVSFQSEIVCRLISKGVVINELLCNPIHHHLLLSEHLLVFSGPLFKEHICCELDATTSEIRFEFNRKYVIECGVQMLAEEGEIKLASSFHDPNREVRFLNCMKLDEKARRAIVQGWAYKYVCFPGKEIPAEFTHKATGNSITITKGTLSASTSFRACILLSPNLQHPADYYYKITCCLRSKGVLINDLECYPNSRSFLWTERHPLLTEHIFVFTGAMFKERRWVEVDSDIHFEFSCNEEHLKIVECGLQIMAEEGESSSREWKKQSDGAVKVSKDENIVKTNKHTSRWSELKKLGCLRKKKKNKRE
uniref:ADP-ribosyl cyclase/cyclic ADP-ribose hydrolase n=1 Tax=Brassica campestris TaxID=3711 RepID=M4E9N7_BRACM